MIVIQEV